MSLSGAALIPINSALIAAHQLKTTRLHSEAQANSLDDLRSENPKNPTHGGTGKVLGAQKWSIEIVGANALLEFDPDRQ